MYGLKQISIQWYLQFNEFIFKHIFVRSDYDNCVYILKMNDEVILYLLLYVDDILMTKF